MSAKKTRAATPRRSVGRPKLEEVAALERKLLAAALQEFITQGYGATSLTRIVQAAGVSKTTLYSRFPSKEALFHAIMQEQIKRLDPATALKSPDDRPHLEQGLKAYANRMLALSLQGELLAVNRLIASESHRFPELAAAAAERATLGTQRISAFIQACAEADGVPCRDPQAAAEVFISVLRGWHAEVMLTNRKVTTTEREQWVERAVHVLVAARKDW